jgi:hypothetical protein
MVKPAKPKPRLRNIGLPGTHKRLKAEEKFMETMDIVRGGQIEDVGTAKARRLGTRTKKEMRRRGAGLDSMMDLADTGSVGLSKGGAIRDYRK